MRTLLRLMAPCLLSLGFAHGQDEISRALTDPALDMRKPADREKAAKQIAIIQQARKAAATAKAKKLGLAVRTKLPDGTLMELMDFEGDKPLYLMTCNRNAAISTAANKLHSSPYSRDGSGVVVGVWDGGHALETHQEFGGRLTGMDVAAVDEHATHVAGTIGSAGVVAAAKGMAPNTTIHSYDWNSDISEMTAAAVIGPGDVGTKISVSNHSYAFSYGWNSNTWGGTGTDQNAYESGFGRYATWSRSIDNLSYSSPYYLSFWAAGNDRGGTANNPATGSAVTIGGVSTTYDPAIHPPGDAVYKNGFDTLGIHAVSKNIITVGAVNDAVTDGARDPAKATLYGSTAYGPADDGRIKPDIVANGIDVYSPLHWSDDYYGNKSGTSMASPNACGSAVLLIDHYKNLFPGQAMRASTLKGLILHTATDIGNAGPDYKHGWGLMDTQKAAELLSDHAANPGLKRLTEDSLSTSNSTDTFTFNWYGSDPIRATICWTDPATVINTGHDDRVPDLINDLDIKIIAPDGTEYFPYVMPFVGNWSVASMDLPATTGINHTDNVEQIYIPAPGQQGQWQVVVSHTGNLTNASQEYGLLIDGSFKEQTAPEVGHGAGPSTESLTSATLRGVLTAGASANVWICWGESDGGTTSTSNWDHAIPMGFVYQDESFSTLVTGLTPNATYYYRCFAANSVGEVWSSVLNTFHGKASASGTIQILPAPVSVTATSQYSSSYAVTKLFDETVTTADIGVTDTYGNATALKQYAWNGSSAGLVQSMFMDFGSPVTADGLVYSQRSDTSPASDKVLQMEFWFESASPGGTVPTRPPDTTVAMSNVINKTLTYDALGGTFSGRYVVARMTGNGGYPGGGEFRLTNTIIANQPASSIASTNATFHAVLNAVGTNYDVHVHYGTTNGGTNPEAWDSSQLVGSWAYTSINVSHTATALLSGTRYYYTFSASNGSATVWATPSWQLTTPGPVASYTNWTGGSFAKPFIQIGAGRNQDGDSLSNLLEFAFGTDPTTNETTALAIDGSTNGTPIPVKSENGVMEFYFVRRKDHGTSGSVNYIPQFSSNLGTFYNFTEDPAIVTNSANPDYEVVKVPYPTSLPDSQAARFGRLSVAPVP